MHILNDPSFFLTNKIRAPQGEELGLMKPLLEALVVVPTIPSFWTVPIDTALELWARLLESSRSGIPSVELEEDPTSPRETLPKNLERLPRRPYEVDVKKNKEKEPQVEKQKRVRNAWTQVEELLLAECYIQVSEDPKTGCDQKRDTFWYKILNVSNKEANKKCFTERTKNMLMGKWTPMNTAVLKFNQLVQETAVHSGENDDDHMSRVYMLYDATVEGEFKHRSAGLFLKGKYKWTNPDSTLQRRSRFLGTDEEREHFGDDELPRPPGLQRLAKSQRTGSNSTANSGSNSAAC
ncbi:hypothetical protein Tco_0247855 [Tanacetum coccineum]